MRKIIQIAVSPVPNISSTQSNYVIIALCDDGTVWEAYDSQAGWDKRRDVPQEVQYAQD